jgi:hypothetical protein
MESNDVQTGTSKSRGWLFAAMAVLAIVVLAIALTSKMNGLSSWPAPRPASDGAEPRYTLVAGNPAGSFTETYSMVADIDARIDGDHENLVAKVEVEGSVENDLPDASGESFGRIRLNRIYVKVPGLTYDSAAPSKNAPDYKLMTSPVDEFDRMWDQIKDLTIVVKYTPDGGDEVVRIEGVPERGMTTDTREFLDSMLEPGSSGVMFEKTGDILPDRPVGIGAVWHPTVPVRTEHLGRQLLPMECELLAVEQSKYGPIAVIGFRGRLDLKDDIQTPDLTITQADMRISGKLRLEMDTGLTKSNTGAMEALLKVKMAGKRGRLTLDTTWESETMRVPSEAPNTEATE